MDFGDIIYFILIGFFLILGFFNDSRKKKRQKQMEANTRPLFEENEEEDEFTFLPSQSRTLETQPPPIPASPSGRDKYKDFQSSVNLVSIHDEQSSQPGYAFDYDANSFYEKDTGSIESTDNTRAEVVTKSMHPLIKDLRGESGREELKKGLIYKEIIQRKY